MYKLARAAVGFSSILLAFLQPAYGDKHEKWVEARSQNFIVVSNGGQKQAQKTAVQFEQIRAVFREYLSVAKNRPSPVITIIAAKDEDSARELMPEFWEKGHVHPAGAFLRGLDQQEIIIQLDAGGLNPYAPIYHEYYHSLTMPYFPGLPLWLAEGMADFFGYSHVEGQKAYMGEPDLALVWELRGNPQMIPLDVLFKVTRTSPYYNEAEKTNMFYAESWALTHYFWMADKGSHKPALMAYLTAVGEPGTTEEQAAKAFGDLRKLQDALQAYVGSYQFSRLEAPAPPVPDREVNIRELSEAEKDAYLGEFEAIRGKPQAAKPLLEEAIKLDPNVALAYQSLGVAQYMEGDRKTALESFSKAVALDPKKALSHYFRAYIGFGQEHNPGDDSGFEDDLRQAIALDPNFAPPFVLLANHLAASGDKLPEALSVAKQVVTLEPGNSVALLALAHVLIRMRSFNDAQIVAQWAQRDAQDAVQRQLAEQMLASIQEARSSGTPGRQPLAPSTTERSSVSDDQGETQSHNPGSQRHAIGVVKQSSCVNGIPEIELKTELGVIALHGAPGGDLNITLSSAPPAGFDPCKSLKGYRAAASYTLDGADETRGTVTVLRLIGSASDAEDTEKNTDGAR